MILRSNTFVIKLIWKIQMGLLQPFAFLALLSFAACYCVANWKAFSFIIASVEVGSVTQLTYVLKSPGSQPFASVPPDWSQARCCRLVWLSNVANLSCVRRFQVVNKPGPGPHILFKLTTILIAGPETFTELISLDGCQMKNRCAETGGNYVTYFSSISCDHHD